MNIAFVEWYQRLPAWLQVAWPVWMIAGVILAAVSAKALAQRPPEGVIERPTAGAAYTSPVQLAGTVSNLPQGHSLWLAVRKSDRYWPKEPALVIGSGKWAGTVSEESTPSGSTLTLALLAANPSATTFLHQWFRGGPSGTHFPGLRLSEVRGLEVLSEVPVLLK